MTQDFQVADFLPDSSGRTHGNTRSIFDAAAGDDALALQQRSSRVVAKTNQEFRGNNGQTCSSVKHNGNEERRGTIHGLKKEINNDGRASRIIGYLRHGKTTTVSWGTRPVK